jgi:hypothetical protein
MKSLHRLTAAVACLALLSAALPAHAGPTYPPTPPFPPTGAATDNGAYVVLGKPPQATGQLDFKYGWNNTSQFYAPATAFWIGLYDVTNSHYVWVNELPLPKFDSSVPGTLSTQSVEFRYSDPHANLPPGDYCINFFVRETPSTNVAVVQLFFTVK